MGGIGLRSSMIGFNKIPINLKYAEAIPMEIPKRPAIENPITTRFTLNRESAIICPSLRLDIRPLNKDKVLGKFLSYNKTSVINCHIINKEIITNKFIFIK